MTMKAAPPGWQPHKIAHRLDGWVGAEDRIPASVAEMIAQAMPPLGGHPSIAGVRARMRIRHRMLYRHLKVFGRGS